MNKERFICEICGREFSYKYNLNAHNKKKHRPSESEGKEFICEYCPSQFKNKYHLRSHLKQKHNVDLTTNVKKIDCPVCRNEFSGKNEINKHLESEHDLDLSHSSYEFDSFDDFIKWKEEEEAKCKVKFVKERGMYPASNGKCHLFVCHRNGFYVHKGHNKRHLKTQGSCKINGYCPARMRLVEHPNGVYQLQYRNTHVGHDDSLGHLTLSETERRNVAEKIAKKIPFDEILDSVRNSVRGKCERLHILSRKDLFNIEKEFNLNSSGIRHENDAISVDFWVEEVKNSADPCIKLYKPQGETHTILEEDDFCLIVMNDAQRQMLVKFGKDKITVDGTHGIGNYGFQLITLMTIDDLQQGFPAAFMITNKVNYSTLQLFFNTIKTNAGTISTNIFMSDMEESFYSAWVKEMGKPGKRLFCTWHVDRAWRKNIRAKIKISSKQAEVYKMLRVLLLERDEIVFCSLKEQFLNLLQEDSDLNEFYEYFNEHYSSQCENWAYCFRKKSGINTNMHLERMHRTLKHIYFQGKNIKRLDKALCALMKLIRDKIVDRLIILHKGKLTSKLKLLRDRHKTALKLNLTAVMECEEGWLVPSATQTSELYLVARNEEMVSCSCKLFCSDCNVCIHQFCCTCIDSSIRGNMCKHVHLVCLFITNKIGSVNEKSNDAMDIDGENRPLLETVESEDVFVEQLSRSTYPCKDNNEQTTESYNLEIMKKKFLSNVEKLVSEVNTVEEMSFMWKMLRKTEIHLSANKKMNKESIQNLKKRKSSKEPANKKLTHQRVYLKAKEKRKHLHRNKKFVNPTPVEQLQVVEALAKFPSLSEKIITPQAQAQ